MNGVKASVRHATDAFNEAWNAVHDAQEAMTVAGVPKPIIALLDAPRLALNDTSGMSQALEALEQIDRLRLAPAMNQEDR